MDKKIIGLLIAIIISTVAISGCIGEDSLKSFENEKISFKYPKSFTLINDTPPSNSKLNYQMYMWFGDDNANEDIIVDSIYATISINKLYLNLEKVNAENIKIKNFTMENITFNGKPAIKEKIAYKNGDYVIYLNFIHNGSNFQFAFWANDLSSAESLYDAVIPTIKLK